MSLRSVVIQNIRKYYISKEMFFSKIFFHAPVEKVMLEVDMM